MKEDIAAAKGAGDLEEDGETKDGIPMTNDSDNAHELWGF